MVKSPFLVRARKRIRLSVTPGDRDRVSLTYIHTYDAEDTPTLTNGGAAVRFHACPSRTRAFSYDGRVGRWTMFNGGFAVKGPGCYHFEVSQPGEIVQHRRIAFGRGPCTGG